MSGSTEVAYLQQQTDKMLELRLSQLKKIAKENGLQDEAIEAAVSKPAQNEEDQGSRHRSHFPGCMSQGFCITHGEEKVAVR